MQQKVVVRPQEEAFSRNVDNIVAAKGLRPIKWAMLTFWLTGVYLLLTLLVTFYKADFLNLTIVSTAIYFLMNADYAKT